MLVYNVESRIALLIVNLLDRDPVVKTRLRHFQFSTCRVLG